MGVKRATAVGIISVVALLSGCSRTVHSTVASTCTSGGSSYTDSVTSTINPVRPKTGGAAVFEVDNSRQNSLVIERAIYRYPIPAQVHHIIGVTFSGSGGTADGQSWRVESGQVVVEFFGVDNPWMVNDFPAVKITARLRTGLAHGTKISWKPYSSFEHRYTSGAPLLCSPDSPATLQTMTVA